MKRKTQSSGCEPSMKLLERLEKRRRSQAKSSKPPTKAQKVQIMRVKRDLRANIRRTIAYLEARLKEME